MNRISLNHHGLGPRIAFVCLLWMAYGLYYYGINRLRTPDITPLEVVFSVPVFALIAHGVYFIIDRLIANRFVLLGTACLIALYVAASLLTNWLANTVNGLLEEPIQGGAHIELLSSGFLGNMIAIISNYSLFGLAAFFVKRWVTSARAKQAEAEARLAEVERRLQAEREKKRFEFFMLAGQVSPHFIANLLDGWRLRLGNAHRELVASMERAYHLMVYYMEALLPTKRRVPLSMEVERLKSVIELTTAFGHSKYIELDCAGDLDGYTLPPTALLTLLENSIKHGRTDLNERPVRMDIAVSNNQLRCTCRNVVKDTADLASHGVGLANLIRRLELEYNDRFSLEYSQNGNEYTTQLTITY